MVFLLSQVPLIPLTHDYVPETVDRENSIPAWLLYYDFSLRGKEAVDEHLYHRQKQRPLTPLISLEQLSGEIPAA